MDRMILSIDECLAIAATGTQHDCELRTGQTVINHDGSVPTCCSTFDPIYKIAGNFLEVSREDLQSRKMEASICEKCMKIGAHNSAIYQPHEVFDAAMIQKQTEMRQRYLTRMFSVPQIIEAIYSNKAGS